MRKIPWLIAVVLTLMLPQAPAAQGAPQARIALLVEASAAMAEPWLGTTRLSAALGAADTELRTLPLRARGALWLAEADGPRRMPDPDDIPLPDQRPPAKGAAPNWARCLAPALKWAAGGSPGAVIIISAEPPGHDQIPAGNGRFFVHHLALGPEPKAEAAGLAAPWGQWLREDNPTAVQAALHRLVRLGLSPAELTAVACDAENRPLDLVYEIAQGTGKAPRRALRSGVVNQVEPGTYTVWWPPRAPIGPAKPPRMVRVADSGQTILRAGGTAELDLRAVGPEGEALPWQVNISTTPGGEVLANHKALPARLKLPAGELIISVVKPRLSWRAELAAGENRRLDIGPLARLKVLLPGPGGNLRVPLEARGPAQAPRTWPGHAGSPLVLPPGAYTLRLETVPPLELTTELAPDARAELAAPAAGTLLASYGSAITPQRYNVMSTRGEALAEAYTGRPLAMQPGDYIVGRPGEPTVAAHIDPGRQSVVDLP